MKSRPGCRKFGTITSRGCRHGPLYFRNQVSDESACGDRIVSIVRGDPEPSAPALHTAATSAGVVAPQATGPWMMGWAIPRSRQKSLALKISPPFPAFQRQPSGFSAHGVFSWPLAPAACGLPRQFLRRASRERSDRYPGIRPRCRDCRGDRLRRRAG
jgi:hypothetical protein